MTGPQHGEVLVFVTVGTDHHKFDRLMTWVEQWAAGAPAQVRCVVQHGTSKAPRGVEAHPLLAPEAMRDLMAQASVVVTQGGPSAMIECLRRGLRPVVVPRNSKLREHVDDHQIAFARNMAGVGRILIAEDQAQFTAHLDAAVAHPECLATTSGTEHIARTVANLGTMIESLVATGPTRTTHRRRKVR